MNRQQFNKYLNGSTRPSQRNLNRICEHFKINESQLFVPHHEFVAKHTKGPDFHFEEQFQTLFPRSSRNLKRYLGYYHSYFYSLAYPGKIIRSLICFYQFEDRVFSKNTEHLYDKNADLAEYKFINKYTGIVAYASNRIFIMERDMLWGNSFTMSILYPNYQSQINYLHGLSIGCPTLGRIPSASRIAYEFLGNNINKRQALKSCGLYDPDHENIPNRVLKLIDNSKPPDDFTFQAFNSGMIID